MIKLLLLSLAIVPTTAAALSAAKCVFQHTTSTQEGCVAIETFALCLGNAPSGDTDLIGAEGILAEMQGSLLTSTPGSCSQIPATLTLRGT